MQQTKTNNHRNNEKVVYLPNQRGERPNMAEPVEKKKKPNNAFKMQTLGVLAIGIIGVTLATVPLVQAYWESEVLTQELATAKEQEKEAMQENIQAQEEYKHMQDAEYLADVARRDYYYSKPGEIIFDLGDVQE
ncbi:septum formation initiator family protein [Aerococcaceae bacterium DSM 111021]|nr:septum formation initiator family protein [Aerococcaceae bacterium DSM 111021]